MWPAKRDFELSPLPEAGAWLHAIPSPTRDLGFSDIVFSHIINIRLGISISGQDWDKFNIINFLIILGIILWII